MPSQISFALMQIHNLACPHQNRASIAQANARHITRVIRHPGDSPTSTRKDGPKKMGKTEQQERLKRERDEIAARVASFKATQEKFQREREEFFRRTWRTIRKPDPPSAWS
jgi:hypothetical protein